MLKAASSHTAHLIAEGLLGLAGLILLAGCVLAWSLSQGPIDITALVRREAPRLVAGHTHLTVGAAALTWEGFHDPDAALDIRWRDIAIDSAEGTPPITLPSGRVTLSVSRLVLGQIVPRLVQVDGATLQLTRATNGTLSLDFGPTSASATSAAPSSAPPSSAPPSSAAPSSAASTSGSPAALPAAPQAAPRTVPASGPAGGNAAAFLHDLASPPHEGNGLAFLTQIRQIHIRNATLTIHDEALHMAWRATADRVDFTRQQDGRVAGRADLAFSAGATQATLHAEADLTQAGTHLTASTSPLSPASLVSLGAGFRSLSAVDAPVSLTADATLAPTLAVQNLTATAHMGAGTLYAGTGKVSVRDADARLQTAPTRSGLALDVPSLRITLVPPTLSTGPAPTLTATAHLQREAAGLRADFTLGLDHAAFADLPAYLPPGTGGGSRGWLVQNITAGLAQDGHVQGSLAAAPDLSNLAVTALTGSISATGLTVHWLRPVPPIQNASGKLTLEGPDSLRIDMPTGTQGPIRLSDGHIRITGLSHKDQTGDISVHAEAGLADTVALLNHPRLNLLSRRPIPMVHPSGAVAATITVKMPLDARVTFEQISIGAKAKLTDIHLGAVAAGRDLDGGQLGLTVDTNSLQITGTGAVGGIPATVALDMDFRDGPPSQVLEHVTAIGHASPAQARQAGLPDGIMTGGTAAITVEYADRRNGTGEVDLATDLRDAALTTPIGWSKAVGQDATASARLSLTHNTLTAIDQIRAQGPNLLIASHVDPAGVASHVDPAGVASRANSTGGQLRILRLDQVRIGQSVATGSITAPRTITDPLRVTLRGPRLDLSNFFKKRDADTAEEDDTKRGQAWAADIGFDQVVLARDEQVNQVSLHAESDGLHLNALQLTAGPRGQIRAAITKLPPAAPGGASPGRKLTVDASEAGAVLLAAGVADNIRDGRLIVNATYNDTLPHSPLSGTASLEQFRLTNAPAIARLLTGMTLYGTVNLLRGPGLGFQKALVPFRWQQRVLHMDSARAFSASLGITAQGDIDLRQHIANVTGTIVPAYFFNQLLGKIPVLGQLFSPEKGGGVFAARYTVRGKLADPTISVNPLSALTPGVLRNLFGVL